MSSIRGPLPCLVSFVVATFAAPASAAPEAGAVPYDRAGVKPKVHAPLSTKVQAAQKLAKAKAAAPTITAADWEKTREATKQEILDEQIRRMQRLIGQTEKSDPEMPELLFRLADLWLEKVAYFERQAGALYDPIHAAETAKDEPRVQTLRAKQAKFESQMRAAAGKAVAEFQRLADDSTFASYKRLD